MSHTYLSVFFVKNQSVRDISKLGIKQAVLGELIVEIDLELAQTSSDHGAPLIQTKLRFNDNCIN